MSLGLRIRALSNNSRRCGDLGSFEAPDAKKKVEPASASAASALLGSRRVMKLPRSDHSSGQNRILNRKDHYADILVLVVEEIRTYKKGWDQRLRS